MRNSSSFIKAGQYHFLKWRPAVYWEIFQNITCYRRATECCHLQLVPATSEVLTSAHRISMAPLYSPCYPAPVYVRPWHSFQAQLHLLYIAGSPKDGQLKHSLPNVNVSPLPYKTQGVSNDRMSICTYRKGAEQSRRTETETA